MHSKPIDFAGLAYVLLNRAEVLIPQWLPGGRKQGHEYVCGDLSGGEGAMFNQYPSMWRL
jgi:putative DNA primase/helicase